MLDLEIVADKQPNVGEKMNYGLKSSTTEPRLTGATDSNKMAGDLGELVDGGIENEEADEGMAEDGDEAYEQEEGEEDENEEQDEGDKGNEEEDANVDSDQTDEECHLLPELPTELWVSAPSQNLVQSEN